jgi:hypothetical protein
MNDVCADALASDRTFVESLKMAQIPAWAKVAVWVLVLLMAQTLASPKTLRKGLKQGQEMVQEMA